MTMNITIPNHIQTWIDREIEAGRFASEEQVIVEALERMADERRIDPDVLQELIAEPLAQIQRGEGEEWTPELRRHIKEQAVRNAEAGHKVRDEIKY